MLHPLLKQKQNLIFYAAVWTLIAMLQTLVLIYDQGLSLKWAVMDSLVFNALFACFGFGFWYTCRFNSRESIKLPKVISTHLIAMSLILVVWIGLSSYFLSQITGHYTENYQGFLESSLLFRGLVGILYYIIVNAFYFVFIYSENLNQHLVREAELQTMIKEAEIKSLKFQINPHFIFNSLNSINSLTMTDPTRAGEMTSKLGEYLRRTLSKNETQKSTLGDELESVKLYLEIEKVRFGEKIDYSEKVDRSTLGVRIPSMILQPLFENSIKHGVYESLEPVPIHFTSRKGDSGMLEFSLSNRFDPEANGRSGAGIGLRNIQSRLKLLYRRGDLMKISKTDGVFKVTIHIPNSEDK